MFLPTATFRFLLKRHLRFVSITGRTRLRRVARESYEMRKIRARTLLIHRIRRARTDVSRSVAEKRVTFEEPWKKSSRTDVGIRRSATRFENDVLSRQMGRRA